MNTIWAVLAHAGIGAIQAVGASGAIPMDQPWGPFLQIGLQIGATALHGVVAKVNSNTAPNGASLSKVEVPVTTTLQPGQFVSQSAGK